MKLTTDLNMVLRILAMIAAVQLLGLPDVSGGTFAAALLIGTAGLIFLIGCAVADFSSRKGRKG